MDFTIEKKRIIRAVNKFFGIEATDLDYISRSQHLYDALKHMDLVVAGGAVTSVFNNKKVNDLDMYFRSEVDMLAFDDLLNAFGFKLEFTSPTAITFVRKGRGLSKFYVQAVMAFKGTPSQIFSTFDFTVCCGAYSFRDEAFELHPRFLPDNITKRLVYLGGSRFPLCALYRVKKYLLKGYTISGGTLVHIGLCANRLEITTYADLKTQLRGVDTQFLGDFLESKPDDLPCNVSEVIDEMFSRLEEMHADGVISEPLEP